VLKAKAELMKARSSMSAPQKLFASQRRDGLGTRNSGMNVGVVNAGVAVAEGKLTAIPSERSILKKEVESAQAAADSSLAAIESAQAAVQAARGKLGIAEAAVQRAKIWADIPRSWCVLGLSQAGAWRTYTALRQHGDLITAGAGARSGQCSRSLRVVVTDPIRIVADVQKAKSGPSDRHALQPLSMACGRTSRSAAQNHQRAAPMLSASTRTLRVEMELPIPTTNSTRG